MTGTEGTEQKGDRPGLGKVRVEAQVGGGECPAHRWFYILLACTGLLYSVHLANPAGFQARAATCSMAWLSHVFTFIDTYSPFHEILQTDEELIARLKKQQNAAQAKEESADEQEPVKDGDVKEKIGEGGDSGELEKGRVFTTAELAQYDGSPGSPGTHLAFLGVVYDVSSGSQYYGPGGGYSFFSGRDASRAFVTGQFDEAGLVADTAGLRDQTLTSVTC